MFFAGIRFYIRSQLYFVWDYFFSHGFDFFARKEVKTTFFLLLL